MLSPLLAISFSFTVRGLNFVTWLLPLCHWPFLKFDQAHGFKLQFLGFVSFASVLLTVPCPVLVWRPRSLFGKGILCFGAVRKIALCSIGWTRFQRFEVCSWFLLAQPTVLQYHFLVYGFDFLGHPSNSWEFPFYHYTLRPTPSKSSRPLWPCPAT